MGRSSSSSSKKSMDSTTTKSCQSIIAMASRSLSSSSSSCFLAASCVLSHSSRCSARSSSADLSSSFLSCSARPLGGINTFEYASAREVKNANMECVGFRKLNCGLLCSLLVSPVRKVFPFLATNCAVSLITSRSSDVIPGGTSTLYSALAGAWRTFALAAPVPATTVMPDFSAAAWAASSALACTVASSPPAASSLNAAILL